MKQVALVTDLSFWKHGTGRLARLRTLLEYLARNSSLTLYFLGEVPQEAQDNFSSLFPYPHTLHVFPIHSQEEAQFSLSRHFHSLSYDLVIVEYYYLHWVVDCIPSGIPTYLDAHDIFSERIKMFSQHGHSLSPLTETQEKKIFQKFTKVLFLQEEERRQASHWIGEEKCLLCPHPIENCKKVPIRSEATSISFLASGALPNVDGLRWFHDEVLPLLPEAKDKCYVYGSICDDPNLPSLYPNIKFVGLVDHIAHVYENTDIAMNPVLYGSGLKIKTVEALSYGVPLVTTSVGVQGLAEEEKKPFLIADTAEEFAKALRKLLCSEVMRKEIAQDAYEFSRRRFSMEKCFAFLLHP